MKKVCILLVILTYKTGNVCTMKHWGRFVVPLLP